VAIKLEYRTVFISDLHLGSKSARAKELAAFLKRIKCERLYLVGDIIDMWRLRSRWYWRWIMSRFARSNGCILPVNLAGLPGIAVPAGLDAQGLPLGLQLIGKPWEEGDLLNTAYTLEAAAGFVAKPSKWW